jgi:hypothetical protein
MKNYSIEEINKAILILMCNKEKVTNKRISDISGLSEVTVKRYRCKSVSPAPKKVSPKNEKVSPELKKVSHHSESFRHFLKRR